MIRHVALLALLLAPAACRAPRGHVEHVVLLWLNEPENTEHVGRVVEASLALRAIPGVVDVAVGPPLASERSVVEDDFTLGLVLTLTDEAALAAYLEHPLHVRAREEVLAPLVERIRVHDFTHAGAGTR